MLLITKPHFFFKFHIIKNRKKCLQKIVRFVTEDFDQFLPSSQLIFKSTCIKHDMHYSVSQSSIYQVDPCMGVHVIYVISIPKDGIEVAPSLLQHDIKKLFYKLSKLITEKILSFNNSDLPQDAGNSHDRQSE